MAKAAKITGVVNYSVGDGPTEVIPQGPVELEIAADSTVISWTVEEESIMTAMPKQDFERYVKEGLIVI